MKLPHDPHKRNPSKQVVFHLHDVDQHQPFTEEEVFFSHVFVKAVICQHIIPLTKMYLSNPRFHKNTTMFTAKVNCHLILQTV